MAFAFGDSWDLYAATADAGAGYWDSIPSPSGAITLIAGRFSGSQALSLTTSPSGSWTKSSGQNDAVHHITCAFRQTSALSGTSQGVYFQLIDNVTNQCCIVFRSDGVILLTSATPGGTTLATYSGAVTATNTWYQFEFEVVIHPTAGRFRARKNGNTVDDFDSGATLNTRPGTNSYANKLSFSQFNVLSAHIDDLLWRSDASSVPFVGDIRGYARMPASDVSTQWAKAPNTYAAQFSSSTTSSGGPAANLIWFYSVQAPQSGNLTSLFANFGAGITGNVNMAVYDATGAVLANTVGASSPGALGPGTLLSAATPLTNPTTGLQTFTLGTPVAVTRGQYLWLAMIANASLASAVSGASAILALQLSFTYSSGAFPASAAGFAFTTIHNGFSYLGANLTPSNTTLVSETLQDGTTSYVYDATVNDADLYAIASIGGVPSNVVAVTTRGFFCKSDAGARGAQVQLKSGATTAGSTPTLLSNTFGWLYRTDVTDPATGSAWTGAAVDALQIGPKVTS